MGGYSPKYLVGTKSFGLSDEDAQDKDDWRLRIKGDNQIYLENDSYNGCVYFLVNIYQ